LRLSGYQQRPVNAAEKLNTEILIKRIDLAADHRRGNAAFPRSFHEDQDLGVAASQKS
jgi:hypothetical protein